MLHYLWFEWPERERWDMKVVFANTGKEAAETLQFVKDCEDRWGIPVTWVEAIPYTEKGWGILAKIVTYETASRNGEPFEAMIAKLGIPTTHSPFCSDQLKSVAMKAYMRHVGWKGYYTAIGIRADEMDRIGENYKKERLIYPLMGDATYDIGKIQGKATAKPEILEWWAEQPFDLKVRKGKGNCDNCWKKDLLTLCRNMRTDPASFDWWQQMTDKYGHHNPRGMKLLPPFNFYRGNLSPKDILALSKLPDSQINKMAKKQKLDGCSESCEPFQQTQITMKEKFKKVVPVRCPWHTPDYLGYMQWHDKAERLTAEGKEQTQCHVCGYWYWPDEFGVDPITKIINESKP